MKKILIVDDKETTLELIEVTLKRSGFKVLLAKSGAAALEIVSAEKPDLIIMDVVMPGEINGLEATRIIRKDPRFANIPIIALTANVFQKDIEKCMAAGMNDHMGKPIKRDDLYTALTKWTGMDRPDSGEDKTPPTHPLPPLSAPHRLNPALLPGFDAAAALSLLGDDDTLYTELLSVFRQNEAETAQRIRTAFSDNNADLGHRLAHTLKSSAGSIGATRLEKAALSVELAYRNGTGPHEELINELEAAHSEAMEGIEAVIGHDS